MYVDLWEGCVMAYAWLCEKALQTAQTSWPRIDNSLLLMTGILKYYRYISSFNHLFS